MSTTTLVALDGFQQQAQPLVIDNSSLTETFSIRTPPLSTIRCLLSPDSVTASIAPTNGRTTFTHPPFIILPPFISNALIAQDNRSPMTIFLLCLELILKFDIDHDDNDTFSESAQNHCKHILSLLWAATKELIPSVNLIPGSDDPQSLTWSSHCHHSCITPIISSLSDEADLVSTQPVTADIVQTLAHSITSQTKVWEKMRQDK